jgi:hypothetical protein
MTKISGHRLLPFYLQELGKYAPTAIANGTNESVAENIKIAACCSPFTSLQSPATEFLAFHKGLPTQQAWRRDHLIILSTTMARNYKNDSSEHNGSEIALCALFANEYVTEHYKPTADDRRHRLLTIKISRLDSTGLCEPRQLQRPLLRLLINTYLEFTRQLAVERGWDWCLHVLAKSNPEYLFPESHRLPKKHIQNGRQLVYWWKSAVLDHFNCGPGGKVVEKSWLIPGMEFASVPLHHRQSDDSQREWQWGGVPFARESEATTPVIDIWPRFEDDSISAFIQRSLANDRSVTINQLLLGGLLEQSTDFKDQQSGYFILYSASNVSAAGCKDDDLAAYLHSLNSNEGADAKKMRTLLTRLNVLGDGESLLLFDTPEVARESTGKLLAGVNFIETSVDASLLLPLTKKQRTSSAPAVAQLLATNLIKRKRKD